ncbi:MAG: riboflavin biosynthesis protein RibD [Myxococcales bacterium]|nr:riboflavin biosynthesis protein RibD [Myxococcales bacterium]
MKEALDLAELGRGTTWPNPMVGAVIVKDGDIVGRGYHLKAGGPHAEVMALESAGEQALGATCYVSLEPCCHDGRTPPCTRALIDAQVGEVVYALADPFPAVAGKGLAQLREAGITVHGPLLEKEAQGLNAPFLIAHTKQRAAVRLKLALTLDGMIADRDGQSQWLTGPSARTEVHRLRAQHQAVMVGAETVRADNPRLTPRDRGNVGRSEMTRIIITRGGLQLDGSHLLEEIDEHPVWVITTASGATSAELVSAQKQGVQILEAASTPDGFVDMEDGLQQLFQRGIVSVMCEGGSKLAGQLLQDDLVDRMHIFRAPKVLGGESGRSGFSAPAIDGLAQARQFHRIATKTHDEDIEEILVPESGLWTETE